MGKIREFLALSSKVGFGWSEIVILLAPLFEALIQGLIERCTNTEEQAVEMFTNPTPLQAVMMQRKVVQEMRRDGRIPIRERNAMAWQVVNDAVEAANANPAAVAEMFREVKSPA